MSDFLWILLNLCFLSYGFGCWLWGSGWRDRRAARVEKRLEDRIEAQQILIRSLEQEIRTLRAIARPSGAVKALAEMANLYRHRLRDSLPATLAQEFNRGAVQGLNAAILELRGWL